MSICLLAIDCQVDFCEGGALAVPGATKDMERLAKMVEKHGADIDDIQLTLDSHYLMHIAHPIWWQDKFGKSPALFTIITFDDVDKGNWRPRNPTFLDWAKHYTKQLQDNSRYQLCIWPPHCIIGTVGQTIHPIFCDAVLKWETDYCAMAPRIVKGSNPFTEHYSVVRADCPHPKDPTTRLNGHFVDTLKEFDTILIAGEALSHCVANSVRDTAEEFSPEQIKKFVLLEDASSNVAGFESQGNAFIDEMVKKGMQLSTTDKFFK